MFLFSDFYWLSVLLQTVLPYFQPPALLSRSDLSQYMIYYLHICALHLAHRPRTSPCIIPVLSTPQNITADTYLLPRSHNSLSRISYFPWNAPFASPPGPAGIYYKPFTPNVLPFVIHQARQSYWNIAVALPVAWMRPAGTFLGLQ